MSNDRDDDQGRHETVPFGQVGGEHSGPPAGGHPGQGPSGDRTPTGSTAYGQQQPSYGQAPQSPDQARPNPYEQPAGWGQQPYGQPSYEQPGYGQPAPYAQSGPYGQPGYGSPSYGAVTPGQPPYDLPRPARPGSVITAAVLGLLHAGLGVLTTVLMIAGGTLIDDLADAVSEADPTFDESLGSTTDGVQAFFLLGALLALAWTVVMVWGSVLALRGRSRVLLLVGSSIAVATSGLVLLFVLVAIVAEPGEDGQVGAVLVCLLLFLAALAMLVLLCLRSAAQFYAAHRQRRAYAGR